jgi:glycosyltransferase involved in cell wall biosynthesis
LPCQSLRDIKKRFHHYTVYRMIRSAKRSVKKCFNRQSRLVDRVISLTATKPSQGDVLLSLINEPFILTPEQAGMYGQHTHYWAVIEIASVFMDLGYNVDIIRWNNNKFIPQKKYSLFMDFRENLQRLSHLLSEDCIKIMYIETAHWLFHMKAQYERLFAIQQRRGVTLSPYKTLSPNFGIEYADCATVLGNSFTMSTYSYANKNLYHIPVISPVTCKYPSEKDFYLCRKQFLWFGSGGLVHKGLDLVLEAFSGMPDHQLIVCGPIQNEKDFEKLYFKELYQTDNIQTYGWIDASSPEFIEIANRCVALIYPSCSEGGGGSVATCMHAGLIPIISYESSIDISNDFGMLLQSCSIEKIREAVRFVSDLPCQDLKEMSLRAWKVARTYYTRENFAEEFRKAITNIITTYH